MEMLDLCRMHGNGLQCDDKGVLLKLGRCLTYNDTKNTATLGMCPILISDATIQQLQ